jgi:hypothetical protein
VHTHSDAQPPSILDAHTRFLLTRFTSATLSLIAVTDSHATAHSLSIAATHTGISAAPRPTLPFGTIEISSAFGLHLPSAQHHTNTNILQYQLERPASPTHELRRGPSRSLPFSPSIHAGRSCRHRITLRDVCTEHHHQTANVQRERNLLSKGVVSSCPSSFSHSPRRPVRHAVCFDRNSPHFDPQTYIPCAAHTRASGRLRLIEKKNQKYHSARQALAHRKRTRVGGRARSIVRHVLTHSRPPCIGSVSVLTPLPPLAASLC